MGPETEPPDVGVILHFLEPPLDRGQVRRREILLPAHPRCACGFPAPPAGPPDDRDCGANRL